MVDSLRELDGDKFTRVNAVTNYTGLPKFCNTICTPLPSDFDIQKFVANAKTAMHRVDIQLHDVNGHCLPISCLFDSGTQVSILREEALTGLQYDAIGRVELKGFDNHKTTGYLISLPAKLNNDHRSIPVKFVVCKQVSHDCCHWLITVDC